MRSSRARFAADEDAVPGVKSRMLLRRCGSRAVRAAEVTGCAVVIDLNHPRSDQSLRLEVERVAIPEPQGASTGGREPDRPPGLQGRNPMSGENSGRASDPNLDRLLAYAADLELEVDRLRRHGTFIEREATATLLRILRLCTAPSAGEPLPTLAEVVATARTLLDVVKDMHDVPGYHPAHDQVVAIAVRPLAEQVFRWQQRLTGAREVALRLELESEHVEWFPARLRHILDNLLAHALRHRDAAALDPWVSVGLRASEGGYELRMSGSGTVPLPGDDRRGLDLFYRAGPIRGEGLGAGLAVVRLLVEQSGGRLAVARGDGGGTEFLLTLPRYDLLDYLE